MNRDDDMKHIKSAGDLRDELAGGKRPRGTYGDAVSGRSFSDEEAGLLLSAATNARGAGADWRTVFAGPGMTCWTVIDCSPPSAYEQELYSEIEALEVPDR